MAQDAICFLDACALAPNVIGTLKCHAGHTGV